MANKSHHAARDRRYDGPPPQEAAAWLDSDASWQNQRHARRRQAWQTVRHAARSAIAAKRAFRRDPSVETYRLWRLRRRALDYALTCWSAFRDLEGNRPKPDAVTEFVSRPRIARLRSFP